MKVIDFQVDIVKIPLKKPFKTALRTTHSADDIVLRIYTEEGLCAWGSSAPTVAITGESQASILYILQEVIKPLCLNQPADELLNIFEKVDKLVAKNSSAKAAFSIAIYDLIARRNRKSLSGFLGAEKESVETDITVSVGPIDEMVAHATEYVKNGYEHLKIKVGLDALEDVQRVQAIRKAVGNKIKIRVDANQGWSVDEALKNIKNFEDLGLNLEFIEQPVAAFDFKGMARIKKETNTKLVADESVFSHIDAERILDMGGADILNVKLMKSGGIQNAIKIFDVAKKFNVECMMSCMLESKIGIGAAAALAAANECVKYIDLDAASLAAVDAFKGGVRFEKNKIFLPNEHGLGIEGISI